MGHDTLEARRGPNLRLGWALLLALLAAGVGSRARAQGPQFDVNNPPGSPDARGKLGAALGASGTSGFDATPVVNQQSIFGGRPGNSTPHVPLNQLNAPRPAVIQITPLPKPVAVEPAKAPSYGELELSATEEDKGPPDGLTLDGAIDRLLKANINLLALKYEIPMAEADVLTAGLRNNPIFYADGQLVPYGHFSNARPGGQTQYDVNITQPIDIWRKRRARTLVAQRAKNVTEAQFQDAIRNQVDNLYTVYVDVVAAKLTRRFSQTYAVGLQRLLGITDQLYRAGQRPESDVLAIKSRLEQAQLAVREGEQTLAKALRSLGLLLDIPPREVDRVQVRASLSEVRPLPTTEDALVETAINARPDLRSYRSGQLRADADVVNANAQRYSDVYLLYQPYTFQNNAYQGLKSAYSYAIGATIALPVFNRNQGNIMRSKLNAEQSRYELANQQKQVAFDVQEAVREYDLSRLAVIEYRNEIIPASRASRDAALRRFEGGETSVLEYLEAQQDYNEVVRQYRDALVRARRAQLDLNTAVGTRVSP